MRRSKHSAQIWLWWQWLVVAVVGIGLFLRLVQFGHNPVSLYWDEMAIWNDARSIVTTGRDLHNRSWLQPIFISYGDYKLPVYIWSTALASLVIKDPLVAVRLPSLIAGISLLPAIYILTKHFTGSRRLSWLSLAVAAIVPWGIHFSRVGFEGHLSLAWLVWSLVAVARAQRPNLTTLRRWVWWLAAAALGALAVYTYFSTRFVWPVVFVAAAALWQPSWWPVRRWQLSLRQWLPIGVALLMWGLLLIPMYRADFFAESNRFRLSAANILNQPDQVNQINLRRMQSGNTIISRLLFNRPTAIAQNLWQHYLAFLSPSFLFTRGDPNLRHGEGSSGIVWLTAAPFLILGVIAAWRKWPRLAALLSVWWVVAVLPAAIPMDVPHALRSLNAWPVFIFSLSLGLWSAWQALAARPRWRWVGLLVGGSVVGFELLRFTHTLLWIYPAQSAQLWQDGYTQTAQYIAQQRDRYVRVYVYNFDERFFLYYQPFSGFTYRQIQQMPSQNFARAQFGNVYLKAIHDWNALEHNSLIIVPTNLLPQGWFVKDTIFGAAGQPLFVSSETPRD
jgi:4-amino-4-deoxy-L-arabinose transferase-like glycosyltransferase